MGYHETTQSALVTLLDAALESNVPVLNGLAVTDAQVERYASAVMIVRESIDVDLHPEVNPSTSVADQPELWLWALYVKGGGGSARPSGKGAQVDLILESVRTALNAQRLTTDCGPLHLVSEEYEGPLGTGVLYVQRWRHTRLAG